VTTDADEESTVYLGAEQIIRLHGLLFGLTPVQAGDRLRSKEVLEGAVGRPRQHAHYGGADLADQAAVLVHGIAEGQPFVDGNKRTSLVALFTFLEANGYTLRVTEAALAHRILGLSEGVTPEAFGSWIREALMPREREGGGQG
jgi:death-on-curing protein